jgi:hypothetical protein
MSPSTYRRILQRIAFELWGHAVEASADHRAVRKNNVVYWRLKKDGWWTVRCCGVNITLPGCYRFTDRELGRAPKTLWPLPVEDVPPGMTMEVTVHETELTDEIIRSVIELACEPQKLIKNEAFELGRIQKGAWSHKAREHAGKLQKARR